LVKKKLAHFAENLTFRHLFQEPFPEMPEIFHLKGIWNEGYFLNDHPITLELGCGKGEYTVNLAQKYPERNFIGIDIKGARLWKGCKMVQELGLKNVAFVRTRVEFIDRFFGENEVSEIWVTFPDPYPITKYGPRRLTSPEFLERYRKIMRPGTIIHLKTDNGKLYDYTLGVIDKGGHNLIFSSADIYQLPEPHEATLIQTFYEEKFRKEGIPIKYAEFKLGNEG
jgi:tRNA (guanine-N7-)-methyltransferase